MLSSKSKDSNLTNSVMEEKRYPYQHRQLDDLPGEEWIDLLGFDGSYMISNLGRVKSLDRIVNNKHGTMLAKGRILSQTTYYSFNGHTQDKMVALRVALSVDNIRYDYQVRRLMYQNFIGELDPAQDVINKDGDGFDNRIDNLKMITRSAKQLRVVERKRQPPSNLSTLDRSTFKKTWGGYSRQKPILQYNPDGSLLNTYPSISEAVRQTGCDEKSIIEVAKGRWKHHRGFIWKYQDNGGSV